MGHCLMFRRASVWLLPAYFALAFALLTDCVKAARAIATTTSVAYPTAVYPTTIESRAVDGVAAISGVPSGHDRDTASWSRLTDEDDNPDQFCLTDRLSVVVEGTSYVPQDRTSKFGCRPYSGSAAYARGPPSV